MNVGSNVLDHIKKLVLYFLTFKTSIRDKGMDIKNPTPNYRCLCNINEFKHNPHDDEVTSPCCLLLPNVSLRCFFMSHDKLVTPPASSRCLLTVVKPNSNYKLLLTAERGGNSGWFYDNFSYKCGTKEAPVCVPLRPSDPMQPSLLPLVTRNQSDWAGGGTFSEATEWWQQRDGCIRAHFIINLLAIGFKNNFWATFSTWIWTEDWPYNTEHEF